MSAIDTDRVLALADDIETGECSRPKGDAVALRALVAERQAVLDLHPRYECQDADWVCPTCGDDWPCPTGRALGVTEKPEP